MVCLGNICRSPLAEGILRHKLEANKLKNIIVDSAGTSAYHIGEHPDERSTKNAKKYGVDISTLRARKFIADDFDRFDKIYVMDASNYNEVCKLASSRSGLEKVKLILNELQPGSNKQVPDPYFGGEEGFEAVFQMLDKACDKIIDSIITAS